jgi:hypothetical protein
MRGILISASGFTAGANEEAEKCLAHVAILLFGPNDLETIVFEKGGFDRLLKEKLRQLLSRRTVQFS